MCGPQSVAYLGAGELKPLLFPHIIMKIFQIKIYVKSNNV